MSFETAVEDVVPEVRAARWGVQLAVGIVALAIVGFVVWWVLFRPDAAQRKAVAATATTVEVKGDAAKAGDAAHLVIDLNDNRAAVDATTRSNADAIRSAPGASVAMPVAVDTAGRRALCLRPTYRDQPACVAVLDAHPD